MYHKSSTMGQFQKGWLGHTMLSPSDAIWCKRREVRKNTQKQTHTSYIYPTIVNLIHPIRSKASIGSFIRTSSPYHHWGVKPWHTAVLPVPLPAADDGEQGLAPARIGVQTSSLSAPKTTTCKISAHPKPTCKHISLNISLHHIL